jgi:ankyrin repeat protein
MTAINALMSLGANINAVYHGSDPSTTPLALAAYFGEPTIAEHLISQGADGTLLDSKGRNTLHGITKYFPDRHGYLRHHWHYWIRHGAWNNHLVQLGKLVKVLIEAGADVNTKDKGYPCLTPIAAAAESGSWDGGMICALLDAGANLDDSIPDRGGYGPAFVGLYCWAPSGLSGFVHVNSEEDSQGHADHRYPQPVRRGHSAS